MIRKSDEKRIAPFLFSSLVTVIYSSSICLYETNFPYEGGHSISHFIFKTCVCFKTQKHIVEEAKMLIKLILVDSNHFIRYKCKTMHCLDSQTLSAHISTIVLDDNEKCSISEVLEVLIAVETFPSASSFNTQRFQFVTMNELKVYAKRFVTF